MLAFKLLQKYNKERGRAAKRIMGYDDTEEAKKEKLKIKKKTDK